jgi:putative DNA primase/helicase
LPYLRFEAPAFERYAAWLTEHERRLAGDELHPALQSHFAKYRKLIPGLALICHLADRGQGPVTLTALERALLWAAYLETHAHRAYGSFTAAAAGTAEAILAKIASGHLRSPFRSYEVWRPGWALLRDRDTVAAGLRTLVEYEWLGMDRSQTAGRTATVYTLNPRAKI